MSETSTNTNTDTSVDPTAVDLADEIKSRSAGGAAEKLAQLQGHEIAAQLMSLNAGFAQDVLGALPTDARERAISAAPPEIARQWQRNALYDPDTVGRMMEPVAAAFQITFAVNSVGHLFGSQRFDTGDGSRNNWLIGLLALGEGWHNNHHRAPTSARHGFAWYELDLSYLFIRTLERLGLVWDVKAPPAGLWSLSERGIY